MDREPPHQSQCGVPGPRVQESYAGDDDYLRFLLSLSDDYALPEEDDDDPDFATDLQKLLEEISDDDGRELSRATDWWLTPSPTHEQTGHLHPYGFPSGQPLTPLTPNHDLDEIIDLSPARCTRSQCSLNTLDIEQLEQRLQPYVDYTTFEELPEMSPLDYSPGPGRTEGGHYMEIDRQSGIEQETISQPPKWTTQQTSTKRKMHETPSVEFQDIFLHSPEISQTSEVMAVNTLNGVVDAEMDAWTPEMILCLNRIVNAHTQLLIQSISATVGLPQFHNISEEMHSQLHSLYQMFHVQSDFDYGFETMLKNDLPLRIPSDRNGGGSSRRIAERRSRKRRRRSVHVTEAVIDLTTVTDTDGAETGPIRCSLDVPLLHILPHLWQVLMAITVAKQGMLFEPSQLPPCSWCKRRLPFLEYPKDVQKAMQLIDDMMTVGLNRQDRAGVFKGRAAWSPTEVALLQACVEKHGDNFHLIKTQCLPAKDINALQKRVGNLDPATAGQWKSIEETLLGIDKVSVWSDGMAEKIFQAQMDLFSLCNDFSVTPKETQPAKLLSNLFGNENVSTLKLLQGLVHSSTRDLMEQLFGQGHSFLSTGGHGSSKAMENIMCLLLGQIGGHLAGSFDTLFTMMSMIAGMQLLSEAEHVSGERRAQILALLQQGNTSVFTECHKERTDGSTIGAENFRV